MRAEATPILCRACGGPLAVAGDLALVCPYCGTPDELPQDAAARARELARRLDARAHRVAQLSAADAALVAAFETPGGLRRVLAPWLVAAPLLVLHLVQAASVPAVLPADIRAEQQLTSLSAAAFLLALPLGTLALLLHGRRLYRERLRGKIQARPPRVPGARPRCRSCAGELPRGDGPLLACAFCRTHNLLSADALAFRAELVAADERSYRAHLAAVGQHTSELGLQLDTLHRLVTYSPYLLLVAIWILPVLSR